MSVFRHFREHVGWSQTKLAGQLGLCGQSAIGNYERGSRSPDTDIAYRFIDLARTHNFPVCLEDIYPRTDGAVGPQDFLDQDSEDAA